MLLVGLGSIMAVNVAYLTTPSNSVVEGDVVSASSFRTLLGLSAFLLWLALLRHLEHYEHSYVIVRTLRKALPRRAAPLSIWPS